MKARATTATASLVAGTSRFGLVRRGGVPLRTQVASTVATPVAAMNRMNSSPRVSKARYSKLTADTTPVA